MSVISRNITIVVVLVMFLCAVGALDDDDNGDECDDVIR